MNLELKIYSIFLFIVVLTSSALTFRPFIIGYVTTSKLRFSVFFYSSFSFIAFLILAYLYFSDSQVMFFNKGVTFIILRGFLFFVSLLMVLFCIKPNYFYNVGKGNNESKDVNKIWNDKINTYKVPGPKRFSQIKYYCSFYFLLHKFSDYKVPYLEESKMTKFYDYVSKEHDGNFTSDSFRNEFRFLNSSKDFEILFKECPFYPELLLKDERLKKHTNITEYLKKINSDIK